MDDGRRYEPMSLARTLEIVEEVTDLVGDRMGSDDPRAGEDACRILAVALWCVAEALGRPHDEVVEMYRRVDSTLGERARTTLASYKDGSS